MATKRRPSIKNAKGLPLAVKKLHQAYALILKAETLALGYKAYSDIHGLASRCVHTMERVNESLEASQRAKAK